jgi:hypothetical protein
MTRQFLMIAITPLFLAGLSIADTRGTVTVRPGWAGYPGLVDPAGISYEMESPGSIGAYRTVRCAYDSGQEVYVRSQVSSSCSSPATARMYAYAIPDINWTRMDTGGNAVSTFTGRTLWTAEGFADCTGYSWSTAGPPTNDCS